VADLRENEKEIVIGRTERTVEENAFFKRVTVDLAFTNLNGRVLSGELEFPLPAGAFVCGYRLEINGEMIPGVVCEKEKARVAFENETRRTVDPGLVEQVTGNRWRTRLYPLPPRAARRAAIDYITARAIEGTSAQIVAERDGEDVFVARVQSPGKQAAAGAGALSRFVKGTIVWDASLSAKAFAAEWRARLATLPETGEWRLVVFRHDRTAVREAPFVTRRDLLNEIDALVYDGGTDIARALSGFGTAALPAPALLFTDEVDTLGIRPPAYESLKGLTIASRAAVPPHRVVIEKVRKTEERLLRVRPTDGKILATVWAARRMADLAPQADRRKEEFLALGRRYGVAGAGCSLIVLETLDQYLRHGIEPHPSLGFCAEWKKRRAAQDDLLAAKREKIGHEQLLLRYWEERVAWWKNPKPPPRKPSSGLFDRARGVPAAAGRRAPASPAARFARTAANAGEVEAEQVDCAAPAAAVPAARTDSNRAPAAASPVIRLTAWDPKMPYLGMMDAAGRDGAYAAYLKARETYGASPAFYLDCASWFFKAGERGLGERILTNLGEFKMEDAVLWRSMGWRAREAGCYPLAEQALRKVLSLRGEEAQSRRDLALVLAESGKLSYAAGRKAAAARAVGEAMTLLADAAFSVRSRRSGRRGDDLQVSVIALEELNALLSWSQAVVWPEGVKPAVPPFDPVYRREMPVKLRIVLSWDADMTDIDLHVLEPDGEEAFYGNRRTASGGFVSEDVTRGYGPEEYLRKDAGSGIYRILTNYFASHQTSLTGATTVTACVYTDWGTKEEKFRLLTFRLERPEKKLLIGEVKM
jgi:hypothetical protein